MWGTAPEIVERIGGIFAMISMNDERFFDLAMKAIARQSSDAERVELDSLLASQPELKAEFERLRAEAHLAKVVLPLAAAAESTARELPGYARERLQTKVRQTLGRSDGAKAKSTRSWRWWLVLGSAMTLVVLLTVTLLNQKEQPVIQVAMLDAAGGTRGTETNLLPVLQEVWKGSEIKTFANASDLEKWENKSPSGGKAAAAKIIYDRTAGEVRVSGRRRGVPFQKTFLVGEDVSAAFREAQTFVREQTKR